MTRLAPVAVMWTWDASAPGVAGAGVCDDEDQARRATTSWMLAHGAADGVARQVRLSVGARTLLPHHEPTGVAFRARRGRDGRVRWASAPADA
jgi:Xaa-Pro aminopeptidase